MGASGGTYFSNAEETRILTRGKVRSIDANLACANALRRDAGRGAARVALAVSGGADSLSLLDAMARAWHPGLPRPTVLHVDHGVRGADSREDAAFVACAAADRSLPFRLLHADRARLEKAGRISEARLRAERYRLLADAARVAGAACVYAAHHRDDQVESIVLAALRGAGLNGLAGMRPRRTLDAGGIELVRPLLRCGRDELREALAARGLGWRTDASNFERAYLRNRVRLDLLPRLRGDVGELDARLLRLGRIARALRRRAERRGRRGAADPDALHAEAERLLGRRLQRAASSALQRTTIVSVDAATRLERREHGLHVHREPARRPPSDPRLRVLARPDAARRLLAAIARVGREAARDHFRRRPHLYVDADRVDLPLCVRRRERGDRFRPLGLAATARLKNLFIARRVGVAERDARIVLASARGIVAVEGLPPGAAYALRPETRRVLKLRFVPPPAVRG